MRVLIIGCGYVGMPLGAELARQGHKVFGLRRSAHAEAELKPLGIRPLLGDITQAAHLARLPGNYDWVVNCVASDGGSAEDYRAIYLQGTRNVLAWLAGAPPKKYIYTSSTSVYGQNDGSVVTETSPTEPGAETGRILVETEGLLLDAARRNQFPAVILRLGGIYGPHRGYWLRQYLKGEARLDGAGERLLNMIHRDDVVGAILAALATGQPGQVYNVADNEPVTQIAFFQWLSETLKRPLPPSVPAQPEAARRRGITNKRVSNARLRTDLGYQLKYPTFREGYLSEIQRLQLRPAPPAR